MALSHMLVEAAQSSAICIAFTAVAALFLALRLWTRFGIVRNIGPEDWIILAAFLGSIAYTIAVGYEVHYGQGHHEITLDADNITNIRKVSSPIPCSVLIHTG